MKAIMFPGQGAQSIGMGADLFSEFSELTGIAEAVLGYSIRSLCVDGPSERLMQTQFTQPALYVVNILAYLKYLQSAAKPDYLLGHSVAEYCALFAAGVLDFESGLKIVQKRGELMARAEGGGMAAVLGLDATQVADIIARHQIQNVFVANYNTPRQIVISGKRDDIANAESYFTQGGATYFKKLQVSGAFHSPFMADAQEEFRAFIDGIPFAAPTIPVIANVSARPHPQQPQHIKKSMVEQITAPVRWSESIRYLLAKGVGVKDFEEIGPPSPTGAAIVKPMVMRTNAEAGPLDSAQLLAEEQAAAQAAAAAALAQQAAIAAAVVPSVAPNSTPVQQQFGASTLGSRAFCEAFGLKYAYVAGGMYQGIASVAMVVRLAQAGMLGFFGAGGLKIADIEQAICAIQAHLPGGGAYGINFIAHNNFPEIEERIADLLLKYGVRTIEASAFMEVTPSLVRYRAKGLARDRQGRIRAHNKIIAKVSRPDVGLQFFSPAPERILSKLLSTGAITAEEAEMLRLVPIADALCVEADSGGHTDQGMPFTLIPAVLRVRDEAQQRFPNFSGLYVGAGGGIGTPEAAAAVFVMGVDFLLTGSINQCTVEAGANSVVKDMLQEMNVYDTDYAPSGEMFELGAKVQVLKKGIFFPARANKLVALYKQHEAIDELDSKTRQQIEERYFKRSLDSVYAQVQQHLREADRERAERHPKHRMALIFRRYFKDASTWALTGNLEHKVDFQIHCGPALGAFNQWVSGTGLQHWQARHVDQVAEQLLSETAALLRSRFAMMQKLGGQA